MTSFGWKRKTGDKVSATKSKAFEDDAKDDDKPEDLEAQNIDWLSAHPKRRCIQLEDSITKSKRLQDEAALLASSERYWEATKKLDEALQLTPNDEKLFEMKAQAYLCVGELYPAIHAANKCVELNPRWAVAHQTLGRAHLQIGEVSMAVKNFSRGIHLNPSDSELWTEDLAWALSLLARKHADQSGCDGEGLNITEIEDGDDAEGNTPRSGDKVTVGTELLHMRTREDPEVKVIPRHYVHMRD